MRFFVRFFCEVFFVIFLRFFVEVFFCDGRLTICWSSAWICPTLIFDGSRTY